MCPAAPSATWEHFQALLERRAGRSIRLWNATRCPGRGHSQDLCCPCRFASWVLLRFHLPGIDFTSPPNAALPGPKRSSGASLIAFAYALMCGNRWKAPVRSTIPAPGR